jgi:DNA polymerase-3 subunit delta'
MEHIVGQARAIGQLTQMADANRLSHALLFAGPQGVGRRTTATALAASILCEGKPDPDAPALFGGDDIPALPALHACGHCESCHLIAADTHPDFHLIYKELARYHDEASIRSRVMQNLSIGVVDQFLIGPAYRAATRGKGVIFVIREADLMSPDAQNSLLKTLEEPPPGVTIILCSARADLLLPTTRSRCATIRFSPLPSDFVVEQLVEADIDRHQAAFWARFTGGSLGLSLKFSTGDLYAIKTDILSRLAAMGDGGDPTLGVDLHSMTDKLAERTVADAKKKDGAIMSKNLATRQATGTILQLLATAYSDAMALSVGAPHPAIHGDQAQAIQRLADRFSPIQLADILGQLSQLESLLWRNVNAKIIWDNVVVTCASAAPLLL